MPLHPRRGRASVAVVLALLLGLLACSGDTDEPANSPSGETPAAAPPALTPLWTRTDADLRTVVAHDDEVAVETDLQRGLVGRDVATGDELWRWQLPAGLRQLCSTSSEVSPGGLVGLLLGGRGKRCTVAAALDVGTGELRWTREIPGEPPYHEGRGVDVADETVLAEMNCSEIVRLSLADGTPRSTLAPKDRKCANEAATDGEVVAVLADPETADTPDDRGTGFIPPSTADQDSGAIELYEADTGRRVWRHPLASTLGTGVSGVVSSYPLILTTTEQGHRTTRLWTDEGPGAYVGPMLPTTGAEDPLPVLGEVDGVLVVRLDGSGPGLAGYDVTTGEELWAMPVPGVTTGANGAGGTTALMTTYGLVLARQVQADGVQQLWITRHDIRDPDEAVTLGRVPGFLAVGVDDRLWVQRPPQDGVIELSAYDLGGGGEDRTYDLPTDPANPTTPRAPADGEITEEAAFRACTAVSEETLETIGLDWSGLPDPLDCRWEDRYRPYDLTRSLEVDVTVLEGSTGDSTDSATEVAEDYLRGVVEQGTGDADDGLSMLDGDAVLGEESWAASTALEGQASRLVTRWRNVVIDVRARQVVDAEDRLPRGVPVGQLATATYAATSDVLRGLGAPAEDAAVPDVGADGPTTRVPSVCRLLADDGTRLVPGARPVGEGRTGTEPARRSACAWTGEDSRLTAEAYAVPGAPDGRPAQEWAEELGGLTAYRPLRDEPGLPGRARIHRYVGSGGDYRSTQVVVVVDDLVVSVELTVTSAAPSAEEFEAEVVGLARRVLRASR